MGNSQRRKDLGLLECENSRAKPSCENLHRGKFTEVKRLRQNEVAFSWCENILTAALHSGKFTEVKRLRQNKLASGLPFSVRILAARTLW
jgi:hypothetical protein